ncbi:glycosyltransferase [Pseudomonas huanghezhanensis]|uniref:glycosyltransferase n=1 Tax=Pseudomonas huanghezhanensis TaxID=3002903 RepID=UPI0022861A96|nr:glycosyltransferase [Pseudomonas sp. BSw22131]
MNSAPLVSIVIPAFNPRFFQRALEGALTQQYAHLEVVVCDDSRGDEIEKIVRTFAASTPVPLRYLRNPQRLGFVGNLRECLTQAQGEYIKFLCDDDQLFPQAVSAQAEQLSRHADVHLVLGQRLLWDADDVQLPARLENSALAPTSAVFKGDDLLAIFEAFPMNFIGGLSSALFRREDLQTYLPALTQAGHCFAAMLDLALYVCLMRRGNVIVLNNVLSVERLHPDRLSLQQAMKVAADTERDWLVQMLQARSGESAPAKGWVRYQPMTGQDTVDRVWEELPLSRALGTKQTTQQWRVGVTSESFGELYAQWLGCRALTDLQQEQLPNTLAHWPSRPRIVPVIIDQTRSRASLAVTLDSIEEQLYQPELTLVLSSTCTESRLDGRVFSLPLEDDVHAQLNALLPQLDGAQWFYLLSAGDRLVKPALLMLAERVAMNDHLRCVYGDEGALREGESAEPVFKPDFNLDLLRAYPYVGRALAFSREGMLGVGGFDSGFGVLAAHDVLWRLIEAEGDGVVEHISELMVESQFALSQWLALPEVLEQNIKVVEAHLQRCGIAHRIRQGEHVSLVNRIDFLHDAQPLVSIVVIVKDQLPALQRCVESLLGKTAYQHYELLIVDNGSEHPETCAWLAAMGQLDSTRLRVLRMPEEASHPALFNAAAQDARGDYLVLLNAYAVITHAQWLTEMVSQAQRPEVGIVGAKLFGPEGHVVHAGMILGLHGPAGVPFFGESLNASGYMQRLQTVHDLSAVGGDCLMVRKAVFESVGGLEATRYGHHLSAVDLCLRVRESGYLVVWTPHALLALGSQPPVVRDAAWQALRAKEDEQFYLRWLPVVARDPAYNPNMALNSLGGASFSLEPGLKSGWSPFSRAHLPKVLALPINASAIGHYRVTQPLIELESAGRAVGVINYNLPTIIDIERQSPDIIVLQGRYSEAPIDEIVGLKTYSNARRIFELDDYVIHVPTKNAHIRNMPDRLEMERLVRRGISLCDRVVVSTQPLADALSHMHDDIRVVPNMLSPHWWSGMTSQRRTSTRPRVGWGGGTSHTGDLEIIQEVVRELADEVDWVFFGMCPEALRPYVREFHPVVDLALYPAKLASLNLDLALAPLERHIFNDCKSNLRLLEYGACGYPVICTDTLAYRGYLPCTRVYTNTTEEWRDAIRSHLADPDASYRQGDALREAVLRDFMLRGDNLQHWVNGWLAD